MYRSSFKPLLLAAALSTLAGCSMTGGDGMFRDRGNDYLDAAEIDPMQMPEQVDEQTTEELYVIPPLAANNPDSETITQVDEYAVPRPLPLGAAAFGEHVKIQKLSDRRWILAGLPPSEIWPKVRHFLSSNGLRVVYTDAVNGVIETGWLQFKASTETKDRYRIQMEQGVQPDSTEIHILHLSVPAEMSGDGQVNWPKRSINQEREAWLVDELAAYLASLGNTGGAASLLAQTIGGDAKVSLTEVEQEPILAMSLSLTRAWATIGHAVTQEGMVRYGENANNAVYYFAVGKPPAAEEEGGFFSNLLGFGDDEQQQGSALAQDELPAQPPFSIDELLANLPLDEPEVRELFVNLSPGADAQRLQDLPGYLLVISGNSNNLQVRVRDPYGMKLPKATAQELLKLVRRNLI
ncbi:MAG: outer membrane protein assembly factor BamC [Cellvibrionaceae bacterium]|nr:outer membrane protein assembly factor BamC [Cellvibrionaceae bacterium]